jgi:uncharacterized protein YbjQ (UPF0145 family)
MIITSSSTIDGKPIVAYLGVLSAETILGANVFKDFFAGIRDIVGGRSAAYEKTLQEARDISIKELQERAAELGANAIVGFDLDYETIGRGEGSNMLMVSASGTAVRIAE